MPNRWTFVITLQAFSYMSPFLSCRANITCLRSNGIKQQCTDTLPCCREHFLSLIVVSGPRPRTTFCRWGSRMGLCWPSSLISQQMGILSYYVAILTKPHSYDQRRLRNLAPYLLCFFSVQPTIVWLMFCRTKMTSMHQTILFYFFRLP